MSYISDFRSSPFDLFKTTSAATSPITGDATCSTIVGTRWTSADGRVFVLVQNAGTALAAGKVVQGPAAVSNTAALSPATSATTGYSASYPIAAAIGGVQIQLATSSTAILANEFQGGYINITTGTGAGQTLRISSNTAAATTSAIVITTEDPFTTATDTTSRYTLTLNPYGSLNGTDNTTHGVIVSPASTLTGMVLGVPPCPIPASTATVPSYGFLQTKGVIGVYGSDTSALGVSVGVPGSSAGVTAGTPAVSIGIQLVVAASGYYNMVNLSL